MDNELDCEKGWYRKIVLYCVLEKIARDPWTEDQSVKEIEALGGMMLSASTWPHSCKAHWKTLMLGVEQKAESEMAGWTSHSMDMWRSWWWTGKHEVWFNSRKSDTAGNWNIVELNWFTNIIIIFINSATKLCDHKKLSKKKSYYQSLHNSTGVVSKYLRVVLLNPGHHSQKNKTAKSTTLMSRTKTKSFCGNKLRRTERDVKLQPFFTYIASKLQSHLKVYMSNTQQHHLCNWSQIPANLSHR